MTEQEICEKQRENGNAELYLLLRGTFWRAYDGGAFALARIMGYQVRRLKTVDRYVLGFPQAGLARVLDTMLANGISVLRNEEGLVVFSGGDTTADMDLVNSERTERVVDTTADYRELCQLRRELLDINLADDTLTLASLAATVRQLQIHSLSHLPLTAAVLK